MTGGGFWVPPTTDNDEDYVPTLASGPIGLSALFREPKKTAVETFEPLQWVTTDELYYDYCETRTDTTLLKLEKACGLARGGLVEVDRNRITMNHTSTMKHSVDIVVELRTTHKNQPNTSYTFLPEALQLLKSDPVRFEENYGYYYVSPYINRTTVSMICHIEASSKSTAAWKAMEGKLKIKPPGCTVSSLAITIASIRGQANGKSDMTISMRVVSSGTKAVAQQRFGDQSEKDAVTDAFNNMWRTATTQSEAENSIPYKVKLVSYRSAFPFIPEPHGTPTDPWPPAHSQISVPTHTRLTELTGTLKDLRTAVDSFPSPNRQAHFRRSLERCDQTFSGIKNKIIAAAAAPPLIDAEIHTALQTCEGLTDEIAAWQRRYELILSLIQERSKENPIPWSRSYVPCGATPEFPYGLVGPPPPGCPIRDPPHPPLLVQLPAKASQNYAEPVLPLSTDNNQEILLGYKVCPLKSSNNGWWRTNKAILLRGGGCHFECSSWVQSNLDFEIKYTVGLRSDYDFPELLDPIQRM